MNPRTLCGIFCITGVTLIVLCVGVDFNQGLSAFICTGIQQNSLCNSESRLSLSLHSPVVAPLTQAFDSCSAFLNSGGLSNKNFFSTSDGNCTPTKDNNGTVDIFSVFKCGPEGKTTVFRWNRTTYIPPLSWDLEHHTCGNWADELHPKTVYCKLRGTSRAEQMAKHPAHLFQFIPACFSLFHRYPEARHVVWGDPNTGLESDTFYRGWGLEILNRSNATFLLASALPQQLKGSPCEPILVATQPAIGNGWLEENYRYADYQTAAAFRDMFISKHFKAIQQNRSKSIKLGFLNRKFTRSILDVSNLDMEIQKRYPCIEIIYTDDLGQLSPQQQAEWVFSKDIIISPHGQQEIGAAFIAPCTPFLEVFPPHYVTSHFMPLVDSAHGIAVGLSPTGEIKSDLAYFTSRKVRTRMRLPNIMSTLPIAKTVGYMLEERKKCCKKLVQESFSEAYDARCIDSR